MDPNKIVTLLEEEIEGGELPPGAVLKQELIAERFQVSRQPVRQALNQLLAKGLVIHRSDRSLAVVKLSEIEAADLSELRAILEASALERSGPNLTPSALRKAERINADLVDEEDPTLIEELDCEFHRTLYSFCENERLLRTIDALRRESRRAYRNQPRGSQERSKFFIEHAGIVAACATSDFDGAVNMLRHHLTQTTAKLLFAPKKEA
jgi:DNA-binding GntR family transcriptional regulator